MIGKASGVQQKWRRLRQEAAHKRERVKAHRAEISRINWQIGRMDLGEHYKEIRRLNARLRTLRQMLRYMNAE